MRRFTLLQRCLLTLPGLLVVLPTKGAAQSLEIEARMAHGAFVMHEPISLSLTIRNLGGSPYIVDDYGEHRNNAIRIHLKSQEDGYLTSGVEVPFPDVMVMPGETEVVQADLMRNFPVTKAGRYFAQTIVTRGEELQASRLLMFDIVNGIEIGSTSRPLPEYDTLSRRYTLLYWPRDQVEVLFLRIDETPPGHCVGMIQLGNVVRFVPPRIDFSPDGATLTVLHQSSRDLFVQTTLRTDRDGVEILDRQRLLDPNQSPMARALLQQEGGGAGRREPEADGFKRRIRPKAD